jgi:heptosyltransferase-3
MNRMPIRNALVVRTDRLGDTVLATPLINAVKRQVPGVQLSVVASPCGAPVVRGLPAVDRVFEVDARAASIGEKLSLALALRRERFDVTLCLSEKWWPLVWTRLSGAARRVGFDPGPTQPLKAVALPLVFTDRVSSPNDPARGGPRHEVERYLALLEPLGIKAEAGPLTIALGDRDRLAATEWLRQQYQDLNPAVVDLHLSPKWGRDGWDGWFLVRLCRLMRERLPRVGVLATYGVADEVWAEPVVAALPRAGVEVRFVRRFEEWASLIAACRVAVTMDTGVAHVAAALGVPVVDVFPSRHFEHGVARWSPWQVRSSIVRRPELAGRLTPEERRAREDGCLRDVLSGVEALL